MGTILTNPPTTPNNVTDSWQPLVERDAIGAYGLNKVSLTEWDSGDTRPQIEQGSVIEIDGSLAVFTVTEDLGNTNPPDGSVYVKFTVTGTSVEARLTGTIPSWNATLGGWYNGSGERYSGHLMTKNGTAYTLKRRWRDELSGEQSSIFPGGVSSPFYYGGINTDNAYIKTKVLKGITAGNSTQIPHGLDGTKILHVVGSVESDTPGTWFTSYGSFVSIQLWNAANISLLNDSSLSGNSYKVVVTYEA